MQEIIRECEHEGVKYLTRAGLLCFDCTPPEERLKYPGWVERELRERELRSKRASQARLNFQKPATPASADPQGGG